MKGPNIRGRIYERAFLVLLGVAIALAGSYGLPLLGLALYGSAYRTTYVECRLAQVQSLKLNRLPLDPALGGRVRKTEAIDELSCLDYRELRNRLQEFRVSNAYLDGIEADLTIHTAGLLQ